MVRVRPFAAVSPVSSLASQVASPPYDVVTTEQARQAASQNPASFLHVIRAEIDLAEGTDPYDDAVYAKARENLQRLITEGTLVEDDTPGIYLYRLVMDGRSQTGLVACCHVDDYHDNIVRRHEKTRPDKEDDRTRHILTTGAQAGPVFVTFRDDPAFAKLAAADANARPAFHFDAPDGVTHTGWRVSEPAAYVDIFRAMPVVYVADGHHRAASALRAARERRGTDGTDTEIDWFLVAMFPASEVTILPYNRVVRDLGSKTASEVIDALKGIGSFSETHDPVPDRPGVFGVYLPHHGRQGHWHRLELDPASIDANDSIGSLDAALLQDRVLAPVLGVGDPRNDPRLDFVGGVHSTDELARRVDAGDGAIAFSLYATTIEQLLTVADAGLVMPPKSTWFEPKLRSGLFVHLTE